MNTFEFVLVFTSLLGVLALFIPLIQEHEQSLVFAREKLEKSWFALSCSVWADDASIHYVVVSAKSCTDYAFALHPPSSPFLTVLGRDANHYG